MEQDLELRLVELERRLAHHERMTEELSAVVAEQGEVIDRMALQLRQLRDRLHDVEAGWERSPQDDKPPPHY